MDVDERRRLIELFLRRCVTYADASIERKRKRGEDDEIIAEWLAYRDFTEHTASEVAPGLLYSCQHLGPMRGLDNSQNSDSGN